MITVADELHFDRVCRDVLLADRDRDGIGTLKEKKLHTMLKFFVCEDKRCHEIRLGLPRQSESPGLPGAPESPALPGAPESPGSPGAPESPASPESSLPEGGARARGFVADVLCGNDIFEIQTGTLYPLRDKIEFYLGQTGYNVTVIHPLVAKKRVTYLSPVDAHVVRRVSSPKHEHAVDMVAELYSLLPFLGNPRLRIRAMMLEMEEFRIQNKRGRHGAIRYEKIPTRLLDILDFNAPADYLPHFPAMLPSEFTASEFGRAAGLRGMDVYSALKVFVAMGLAAPYGKRGRAATYTVTNPAK